MKDTSKTSLHRGHNEGNIRQRTDGRWEVRLSAGIDYKTGKPRRTSTCCNTRQEAIAILQQQAHEVRTQGWRDPMSVTLRHTFATRALERGMDYKTLSAILGHYSVAFTMDTYVHSMDEHKRREMDKMDDMFGMQYSISVENQPYPVLCTLSPDGCTAHVPDFPKIEVQTPTLDAALLEVKQQIEKALRQYKNPPIPTKQEQIVVPQNSVLVLVKAS